MRRKYTPPSFWEEEDPFTFLWPGLNTAPIRAKIRARVSSVNLPGWREQADDIVEDIFQEAVIRASQETKPIQNIGAYLTTVADHYFIDLYRRAKSELRLVETIERKQLGEEEARFEQQFRALLETSNNYHNYVFSIDPEMCTLYMMVVDYGQDAYGEIIPDQEISYYVIPFLRTQLGYVSDAVERLCRGESLMSEQMYRRQQIAATRELVHAFSHTLPDPRQSILRLYYLNRCPLTEIAAQMQMPVGTVKSHINRDVKLLRCLKDRATEQQEQETNRAQRDLSRQEDQAKLLSLIPALPERYRAAVHLHYVEQRTYPEIARGLDLPLGTVKSLVSRGMKLLRESQKIA